MCAKALWACVLAQGKRDRKKVNYHGAGGGDMDGSEYEASSDEDTTDEEADAGEEMEPVCVLPEDPESSVHAPCLPAEH